MGTVVFDTLEARQGLINAGIKDVQATAVVDMTRKASQETLRQRKTSHSWKPA